MVAFMHTIITEKRDQCSQRFQNEFLLLRHALGLPRVARHNSAYSA